MKLFKLNMQQRKNNKIICEKCFFNLKRID